MPEPLRFHPLAPDVRCPLCGAALAFIRVRAYGDLYECSGGSCSCRVMHYRNPATKTCGWAVLYNHGSLGMWVARGLPAAEKE